MNEIVHVNVSVASICQRRISFFFLTKSEDEISILSGRFQFMLKNNVTQVNERKSIARLTLSMPEQYNQIFSQWQLIFQPQ